jgi:hypothetical protein
MKNTETGEFELVVGDRQLLSAFFIVVLLCAVAFAMGYVVGQNAPKSGKVTTESPAAAPAASIPESRPQPLPPAPGPSAPPATQPAADTTPQPVDTTPQPTTQPAQASQPEKAETPAPAPLASGIIAAENLPSGNFWQVMAVPEAQAEVMRTTLKDHGFGVILSPGTKNLIRVLVGPYGDTQAFGKAKTDLENAGMHPVRYKP